MKKLLSIAMAAALACGATAGIALTAIAEEPAEQVKVYLMPGSYLKNGTERVLNTVEGAQKLSDEERDKLHLEGNVYEAGETGSELPDPVTTQADRTFNGWWYIKDAIITYTETVPEVTETTYLYADFRTQLSQHSDPVPPASTAEDRATDYMLVKRATGEEEIIPLHVSGTEVSNAMNQVQFFNDWFKLYPGDEFSVYISYLYPGSDPQLMPQFVQNQSWVTLESNGVNATGNYINGAGEQTKRPEGEQKVFRCSEEHYYRIYIKFYDSGATMTIYMQPMDWKLLS